MTARAAAAGLMIVGGVVIVAISVGSAWYAIAQPAWLDAQLAAAGPDVAEQLDALLPRERLAALALLCGVAGAAEGGLSILLGALAARGRRWAIRTSIAVTIFRLLLVGLLALALVVGVAIGVPPDAPTAIVTFVALAVLIATLAFLFRARRAVPPALPRGSARPSSVS